MDLSLLDLLKSPLFPRTFERGCKKTRKEIGFNDNGLPDNISKEDVFKLSEDR